MKKSICTLFFLTVLLLAEKGTAQNTFPATGRAGINTLAPAASLHVVGGSRIGAAANYVNIDSATGNLSFTGTSAYLVKDNSYAFRSASSTNAGLYFNRTALQFEFRSPAAVPVFYVNASSGNGVFTGNLKVGAYTFPATDGLANQVLKTNGAGVLAWGDAGGGSSYTAGTGIDLTGNVITNTAPDQTVSFTNGTGVSVTGTYPNFTVTNSLPDQVVGITSGTGIKISGVYPNYTVTNMSPDQTVALTNGTGISVTGVYPNFTIASTQTSSQWTTTGSNIYYAANVGIGITTPTSNRLDISGTGGIRVSTTNNGTTSVDWIAGNYGGTTGDRVVIGNLLGKATIGAHNNTLSAWAPLILNQGGGNVAIGTANANGQLQLGNTVVNRKIVLYDLNNNDHQYYGFGINSSLLRFQVDANTADFGFFSGVSSTSSSELMRIKGNGNVGIGVVTPAARLDVSGTAGLKVSSTANGTTGTDWIAGNFGGTAGDRVVMGNNSGSAIIGAHNSALSAWSTLYLNKLGGSVVVGNSTPSTGYLFTVAGKMICTELKVQLMPFPDYVFDKNYKLRTLTEVENYIAQNKHLPGMPAAKEVETNGMNVGEMQGKVVEKVEELTLYIIEQQKKMDAMQQQLDKLQQQLAEKK